MRSVYILRIFSPRNAPLIPTDPRKLSPSKVSRYMVFFFCIVVLHLTGTKFNYVMKGHGIQIDFMTLLLAYSQPHCRLVQAPIKILDYLLFDGLKFSFSM